MIVTPPDNKLGASKSNVYKAVLKLSVPIAVQNIFSTAVSTADVVMVGHVGQTALSAVDLANQFYFVLSLIFLGLTLGTSVLSAQYWGKGDKGTVQSILALGLKIAGGIAALFALAAIAFPTALMGLFIDEADVISAGAEYLRIVGISYLFTAVSQIYHAVLKATDRVKISTVIASTALVLNVAGNALLIYGWLGMPRLGVAGVAIATTLSRLIEVVWCVLAARRGGHLKLRLNNLAHTDKTLARDYWRCALPITLNGLSWGSAFATYSAIMGHFGSDMIAANSVVTVARNFAMVGCSGLATGGGIYLGALMGRGELDKAKSDASKIIRLTVLLGVLGGLLILAARPLLDVLVELTPKAREYLGQMLMINSYYVVGKAANVMLNNGIFCTGGDTRFGLICDTLDMWCFSVPLGFICALVLNLPPIAVYFVICLDEFVKLPFIIRHYKSYKWLNNITR